jgi:hypothetical protein
MIRRPHYMWWLLMIGIAGFIFYQLKSPKVFPSASIDLSIPRSRIQAISDGWHEKLGYTKKNTIDSTIFTIDDDAKTFLEYELGAAKANDLMREHIPVWYWNSRSCVPLKQEEFQTWLSPKGRLDAFEHSIENDRKLPSMKHDEAREKAIEFVEKTAGVSLAHYKMVEEGSVSQPGRIDQEFVWEDTDESFKGARLRVHVYISGNIITTYNHFLHVPEEWTRRFAKLRSYNDALENFATIFYYAIDAGAFFVFLWALASGTLRWRFALIVALLYGAIACADSINSLPESIHEYDTSVPWSGFQLNFIFNTLRSGIEHFVQTLVLVGAAEAIYRLMKPGDIALENCFTKIGLRTKQTVDNIWAGFSTFGMHLGWVVVFYLAGRNFGFWSPLDVDSADTLSSVAPFFSAMETGWSAGLAEEMMYRVLGLAAFKKIFRNFWVANLLQAAAWGFMHSNYPQEPPYARGLELTVAGLVYGFILRRFGLLACFFSHNLVDTFMGIGCLLSSANPALQASAFIALAPFVGITIAAIIYIRKEGLTEPHTDEAISNQALTPKKESLMTVASEIVPKGYLYRPLTARARLLLALLTVASVCVSAFLRIPVVGGHTQLKVSRDQAIKIATAYMQQHGVKTDDLTTVAWLGRALDGEEMQYSFENQGRAKTDMLAMTPERPLWWQVRFFKPLVETEYKVVLDQNGVPLSFALDEPEEGPGEKPTKEVAQNRVEEFLRTQHPEIVPFELDDVTEQKRDARLDYTFHFRVPRYQVGDARYVIEVHCIGGKVSGYDTGWSLPDKWKFKRQITSLREQICQILLWVLGLACVVPILIWARGVLRSGAIAWKPAILIGTAMALVTVFANLNDLVPGFYQEYSTKDPLVSFYVAQGVTQLVSAMFAFATMTLAAAFGLGALRLLLPDTSVSAILKSTFSPVDRSEIWSHKHLWVDAVLVGYAVGLGDRALGILGAALHAKFSPAVSIAPLDQLSGYANLFDPTIGAVLEAIPHGLYFVFITACIVGIRMKYLRNFKQYALFGLVVGVVTISTYKYWQDAVIDLVAFLISLVLAWVFVARFAKENLLAYFLAGVSGSSIAALRLLTRYGDGLFSQDCIGIAVVMLAPIVYALLRNVGGKGGTSAAQVAPPEPVPDLSEPSPS